MKKQIIIIAVVFGLIGSGIGYSVGIQSSIKSKSGNSSETETTNQSGSGHQEKETVTNEDIIDETANSEVVINIKDFSYEKKNIKVKKGTKVTWLNQDTTKHNVMAGHAGEETAHNPSAELDEATGGLNAPLLAKGESYSFTFNEIGAQGYHCSPHPEMRGSVTVI